MTIEEIKELIRVVQETGIAELEVQRGENRVRVKSAAPLALEHVTTPTPITAVSASATADQMAAESKVHQLPSRAGDDRDEIIKSPIVGTYYDSPAPGSGPFIRVGERVEAKQVLCIIESMKLMNEIESDAAGAIVKCFVSNGQPIEFGQPLFSVRLD